MKRILQISNYLYPNIGGIEQVARDIANAIASEGSYEQKIICFNENASDGDYVCRRNETAYDLVDGIEVVRCGCVTKQFSQSLSLSFGRELKKIMSNFRPDIVVFHYPNPFEAFFLTNYLDLNFKFVLYWHLDIVKQKLLGKLFNNQTIKLLERADRVIATSPLYIDGSVYLSKYKNKCTVIPNCINQTRLTINEDIENMSKQIRNRYRNRIICFGVGRHVPYKGFKYLVEAAKYLDDRFIVFIAGIGDETENLKELAKHDSKVIFLGKVSDGDLLSYYLSMDIFCFPSITKNEAFGIALAEGMYFGKPAITFNIPGSGVNYVNLDGVTGIECQNCNYKAYASAIKKLADDSAIRQKMGNAARQRILDNFTADRFKRNIQSLIDCL